MKLLHRYIAQSFVWNLCASLAVFILLFLLVDVIDRLDNILTEHPPLLVVLQYFALKIPLMFVSILPIASLTATLFTIGVMSKNSEFTAMRASGCTILWLVLPILLLSLTLSLTSLALSQTVVPYATRRVKEIYNIDIKQKDKRGSYSQTDFWWRDGNNFYSARMFDSRTNTLHDLLRLKLDQTMSVQERLDSGTAAFLAPGLGWTMTPVTQYFFSKELSYPQEIKHAQLPLPISQSPEDFYSIRPEPDTMSYFELRDFMMQQQANGVSTGEYLSDLHEKISFPFITLVVTFVVITFALQSARTGSMAGPILASLTIAFSYYAIHSFCVALGRAELLNPYVAAWFSNCLYGIIGLVLIMGAESAP
jgi:lipopolysaccharide export system permease protein